MRIGIDNTKKRGVGKSGIGIKVIGIARSLFNVGNGVSNCRRMKIALSVMARKEVPTW